jgi:ferrous iron transport protein A
MTLDALPPGQQAEIVRLDPASASAVRLGEMGFVSGQKIAMIRRAPLGEPFKVRIMNYELCLRRSEAAAVEVLPLEGH